MERDQLRTLLQEKPFKPFVIHLADGRNVAVKHSEFLAQSPNGRTVIVYQPDNSFNIIDMMLVTDLEVQSNSNSDSGDQAPGTSNAA